MFDIRLIHATHAGDIEDVMSWCNDIYKTTFSKYFDDERVLFRRLQSTNQPITDAELEDILTTLPLKLFSASEELSKLTISYEVVKLNIKQRSADIEKNSTATTATARKAEAAQAILADELLAKAYTKIIERVEKEMSYSRELIMGAKKIWDSRKRTESVNPISETVIDVDLPDYNPNIAHSKSYIQ